VSLAEAIGEEIALRALPVIASWVADRIASGSTPERAAADLNALFAAADAVIDAAADQKFGPEEKTKP
jgi:hypothetical protein